MFDVDYQGLAEALERVEAVFRAKRKGAFASVPLVDGRELMWTKRDGGWGVYHLRPAADGPQVERLSSLSFQHRTEAAAALPALWDAIVEAHAQRVVDTEALISSLHDLADAVERDEVD